MARATHILQRPAQFQWDWDSSPCKSTNCNPTSVAMIAGFYKDKRIAPTYARRLMQGGSNVCGGTSNSEAVRGLTKLGVPASTALLSASQVKAKIEARIPVILSVNYGKLPRNRKYIQDMGFYGMHAVVACDAGYGLDHRGVRVAGIWVRDPDRWGTGKVSKVFWPDYIWKPAYIRPRTSTGVAVFPKAKKS
jgi:hypothetical protein